MYAVVSLWQLPEDATDGFPPESLLRRVRQSPGFIAGYWTYEVSNGKSFGFTVLDSAAGARDLQRSMEGDAEVEGRLGARLEMVRVQRIVSEVSARVPEVAG